MKLHELAVPNSAQQVARVFESYFGSDLRIDRLSLRHTRQLLSRVRRIMNEHRVTARGHHSERDPGYLKLLMLEQALNLRVKEEMVQMPTQSGATSGTSAGAKPTKPVDIKDPKLAAALKKSQNGQTLTPDEQRLVAGQAMMNAESRRYRRRALRESEIQQAQVVLAAQDLVDKIQAMLEDTTEMQFKELPALVDSIRNQVGMEQANQFNQDATAALSGLVQNLQGSKQQLETALGVVTGQQMAPALDQALGGAAAPAADLGADVAGAEPGGEEDLDLSLDANLDDVEEPVGSKGALGRSRR
jgi:hypothetical protein